jgi:hypothetical protein
MPKANPEAKMSEREFQPISLTCFRKYSNSNGGWNASRTALSPNKVTLPMNSKNCQILVMIALPSNDF